MTAPLFVVDHAVAAPAAVGTLVRLEGGEGRHAVTVARVEVGELVDLTDGRGTLLHTQVESVQGRDTLVARVLDRAELPPPAPRIVVVQAIPKGERGELAVEMLTEVGADVIVPWQAERCIARWSAEKAERGRAKWAAAARAAGKQARRGWFAEVAPVARTSDVVALVRGAAGAILLHEEASRPVSQVPVPGHGDLVLVVGPEGGISPTELDALAAAGGVPARLGPTVLRTSTAGTVAAGIVLARSPRWA